MDFPSGDDPADYTLYHNAIVTGPEAGGSDNLPELAPKFVKDERPVGKLTGRNGSYFLIIIICDLDSRKMAFSVDMPVNYAIEFAHINRRRRVTRPTEN